MRKHCFCTILMPTGSSVVSVVSSPCSERKGSNFSGQTRGSPWVALPLAEIAVYRGRNVENRRGDERKGGWGEKIEHTRLIRRVNYKSLRASCLCLRQSERHSRGIIGWCLGCAYFLRLPSGLHCWAEYHRRPLRTPSPSCYP